MTGRNGGARDSGHAAEINTSKYDSQRRISLPCHAAMDEEDIDYVVYRVKAFFAEPA